MPEQENVSQEFSRLDKYSQKKEKKAFRIPTRLFGLVVLFLILGAVLYFGYSFYKEIENTWNNQNSWEITSLSLPEDMDKYRIFTGYENNGKELTIDIDYCGLYRIEAIPSSSDVTFYCAFIPLTTLKEAGNLDRIAHTIKGNNIEKDSLIFGINLEQQDKLRQKVDRDFFTTSVGPTVYADVTEAEPVQISFKYEVSYPDKNLVSLIEHYNANSQGKKQKISANLVQWSIRHISTSDLADNQKVAFYKEWADRVWFEVNKNIILPDTFSSEAVAQLLAQLDGEIKYCDWMNNKYNCLTLSRHAYLTNFIHYLYTLSYKNPEKFEALTSYLMKNYYPFVEAKPDDSNRLFFTPYPLCPIAELANNKKLNTPMEEFFKKPFSTAIYNQTFGMGYDIDVKCFDLITKGNTDAKLYKSDAINIDNSIDEIAQLQQGKSSILAKRFYQTLNIESPNVKQENYPTYFTSASKEDYLDDKNFSDFVQNVFWQPYNSSYLFAAYDGDNRWNFDMQKSLQMMYDITVFSQDE